MSENEKRRENDVMSAMQWIIRIGSTLAATIVIFGAISWAADTRYAQKGEVGRAIQVAVDGLRQSTIEDKIFEINLVPPDQRTNVQRALLERYIRESEDLKRRNAR